jgi:hypothetical protein
MPRVVEGSVTFDFPNGFVVQKLDDTTFYKKHFQSFAQGSKAVDFLAFDPKKSELWFLEVKDYRAHRRIKTIDLFDEIAQKVLSSLACLLAMRANAVIPASYFRKLLIRKMCVTNCARKFVQLITKQNSRALYFVETCRGKHNKTQASKRREENFFPSLLIAIC